MKEKFIKGNYYDYSGVNGYCVSSNKLILEDGRVVQRYSCKYREDTISFGSKTQVGYRTIKIEGVSTMTHRVVATYFVDNPDSLPIVDHMNENKEDNRASNLRWCTHKENSVFASTRESKDLALIKQEREKIKSYIDYNKKLLQMIEKEKEELLKNTDHLNSIRELLMKELEEQKTEYEEVANGLIDIVGSQRKRLEESKLRAFNKKYSTRKKMIEAIGVKVKVNGTVFEGVRTAARYVMEEENKLGVVRNPETIRKEIKYIAMMQRPSRAMYDKYLIEPV